MTAADLPNKTLHYSSQYQASQGPLNSQPGNKAQIDQTNKENIWTHQTVESKQATNGKMSNLNVSTECRKNGTVKTDNKSLGSTGERLIKDNYLNTSHASNISVKHDMNGNDWNKVANQEKHTGDKRYKCSVCAYSTDHTCHFQDHQLTHTRDKPFKCGECGYSFTQMGNLQRHQKTHSTCDKSYKCDECGYSTNVKYNLKQHQMRHTGEKPYRCDVCVYSTNEKGHLKRHKRRHTDDKPYRCDVCGYSAALMHHLKNHQMTHTGEKPYKCDVCGYSANQINHLKRHQKSHTDDKPQ